MHALEVAAFDRQVARLRRAGADDDRVEVLAQQLRLNVLADVRVADELDAFLLHELQAPLDDFTLVELHVRNAVHQQAAGAIGALEHGHEMSGAIQLRRSGEPGGT